MPRIVVVGGGYAGLRCVHRLDRLLPAPYEIVLLDRLPYHQLLPRLPEIAGGRLAPRSASIPFDQLVPRRIRRLDTEIIALDAEKRKIFSTRGSVAADWLVLTTGTVPDALEVPGALDFGLPLKSVAQAERLAGRLEVLRATLPRIRAVVVGSGYTGTELAGELADRRPNERSGAARPAMDVTVVAPDRRLLAEGNEQLACIAQSVLESRGVRFLLGAVVERVEPNAVVIKGGPHLPADLIVWALRTRAPDCVAASAAGGALAGRVRVDPYLAVPGFDRVFAAGDVAVVHDYRRGRAVPSNAQLALGQADVIAQNICASVEGHQRVEYRPSYLGEVLSLGSHTGVSNIAGVTVTGRAALWAKSAALARYLYGLGGTHLVRQYV